MMIQPRRLIAVLLTASAALLGSDLTSAQIRVDLDATLHGVPSPLPVPLAAGCWRITPVAGTFTAFHAWGGTNSGCNAMGEGCTQGWGTVFFYASPGIGTFFGGAGFFATPGQALASSRPAYLTLAQAATVNFGVADNALGDNLGGVSLQVDLVLPPTPSSETPRAGSPPNPPALLPGVTSGPAISAVWDPVVDHTSFAPAATLDFLAVDLRGPINAPLAIGTLLCLPPPASQLFFTTPGTPFAVSVPNDCGLVGVSACSQAGSLSPGSVLELTNALDLVLGSF